MGEGRHRDEGGEARPSATGERQHVVRTIVAFSVVSVLVGMGAGLIIPFFNVYFQKEYGLPAQTVGVIFAASQGLIGVTSLVGPALAARSGKAIAASVGHVSGVPFLLLL